MYNSNFRDNNLITQASLNTSKAKLIKLSRCIPAKEMWDFQILAYIRIQLKIHLSNNTNMPLHRLFLVEM